MRKRNPAILIVIPFLLAACGDDTGAPPATAAVPAQPAAPADTAGSVPLRLAPEGLLGFPAAPSPPPAPAETPATSAPPVAPPEPPADDTPASEAEVRALYEGIMYTYAFDACGLLLIGQTARQDIERRIEMCPNPPLRKDAFRTVYHRALEVAEQDPEKLHASAARACPDKHEFLRRVMSHAGELQFDDHRPLDCGLLTPAPPGSAPASPTAEGTTPTGPEKPF